MSFRTYRWRLCPENRCVSHFLCVEEVICQSPSLCARPLSKVSTRPPQSHATSLPRRHPPCPGSLDQACPSVVPARCFRPWQRVRSESRRRLIWRCSGKWLACPRIGNASTATSAARPMSTWQWAPSSVLPVLGSCECPFKRQYYVFTLVTTRRVQGTAVVHEFVCSTTDLAVLLAR